MVSTKDLAFLGGIALIGGILIYGGKQLYNALSPLGNLGEFKLPDVNISSPFNFSQANPIETTYPNATEQTKDYLESIQGGFTSLDTTLDNYLKSLTENLPQLGSNENPANAPVAPTPIDIILNDPTLTDQQKKDAIAILNPIDTSDPNYDPDKFKPKEGQPGYDPYNPYGVNVDGETFYKAPEPKTSIEEVIPKDQIDIVNKSFTMQEPLNEIQKTIVNDPSVNITGQYGSGVGLGGFTINENPIDTFSEVLKYFPELTASQSRDFLDETGGKLLPSQVEFFDPDIKNIVAGYEGGGMNQMFEVDTTTYPSELKDQEKKAACVSCELYGLNCPICNGA